MRKVKTPNQTTVVIPAKGKNIFNKPPKTETPKTVYKRKPKHKKTTQQADDATNGSSAFLFIYG